MNKFLEVKFVNEEVVYQFIHLPVARLGLMYGIIKLQHINNLYINQLPDVNEIYKY